MAFGQAFLHWKPEVCMKFFGLIVESVYTFDHSQCIENMEVHIPADYTLQNDHVVSLPGAVV